MCIRDSVWPLVKDMTTTMTIGAMTAASTTAVMTASITISRSQGRSRWCIRHSGSGVSRHQLLVDGQDAEREHDEYHRGGGTQGPVELRSHEIPDEERNHPHPKTAEQQRDNESCLLYTSDAADEEDSVDLGGRRIIKKKIFYFLFRC